MYKNLPQLDWANIRYKLGGSFCAHCSLHKQNYGHWLWISAVGDHINFAWFGILVKYILAVEHHLNLVEQLLRSLWDIIRAKWIDNRFQSFKSALAEATYCKNTSAHRLTGFAPTTLHTGQMLKPMMWFGLILAVVCGQSSASTSLHVPTWVIRGWVLGNQESDPAHISLHAQLPIQAEQFKMSSTSVSTSFLAETLTCAPADSGCVGSQHTYIHFQLPPANSPCCHHATPVQISNLCQHASSGGHRRTHFLWHLPRRPASRLT